MSALHAGAKSVIPHLSAGNIVPTHLRVHETTGIMGMQPAACAVTGSNVFHTPSARQLQHSDPPGPAGLARLELPEVHASHYWRPDWPEFTCSRWLQLCNVFDLTWLLAFRDML